MSQAPLPTVQQHDRYWRHTRRLTILLLASWFLITACAIFFARELSGFTLFGWPFPFYMAAQGLPLLYLVIIAIYVARMRRLDLLLKKRSADAR